VPRAVIVLLCVAATVVTASGIKAVSSIAGPVILALVLVIAVSPLRDRLVALRAPGWVLVAVPLLVVLLVLLGMVAILTVSLAQLATLVPSYTEEFTELIAQARGLLADVGIGNEQVDQAIATFDPGKVLDLIQQVFTGLLGVLSSLFLIIVLLLTMCLDAAGFSRVIAVGHARRADMVAALAIFASRTRRYLVVSTLFGIVTSTLYVIALYLLDIPLPLLWGVLALITMYIPNIGFVIRLVPPALLALLTHGPRTMLLVVIAYVVINVVIQTFILPKFLGDAVDLSTTMTFLSLIVWTFVLGPLGALLAIPLSLLTRALLIDSDPSAKWAAALISGRPPDGTP
jgi:predicted PurR-regulated permease PerM